MTRTICPHCDETLHDARAFDAHMAREHRSGRAPLGFGHTLE